MRLSGAQIIIKILIEQGVDVVFGYPGSAVLGIYDELFNSADSIRHILTAHEQGATHAADGYARTTGKVGVVIATSGPGATNLVTGMANAYLDSIPMVAITGNVDNALLGKDSFQEVDIMGISMPITKHNYIVRNAQDLAATVNEAFLLAKTGRPGPVLIDIPKDVQEQVCEYIEMRAKTKSALPAVDETAIERAAMLIKDAKRPYIYCGGGAVSSGATDIIIALSKKIDAPIGTSMMGISAIPHSYAANLGMSGTHGKFAAVKTQKQADVIVAVGARFSERAMGEGAFLADIIHIDIDPAEIDKNVKSRVAIVGDVKHTLMRLMDIVGEKSNPEWMRQAQECRKNDEYWDEYHTFAPRNIIDSIRKRCDDQTVVATDVGQHQIWTAQYYGFEKPRTHLTSGGLGAMGFGLGAAIGGCIGLCGKRTVLITGDGSFGMNLCEMATAVSQRLPIVVVIMNNGVLGMVRQWQKLNYEGRYSCSTLNRKTDFVALAKAFGAQGYRAKTLLELDIALDGAFETEETVVIDCVITNS